MIMHLSRLLLTGPVALVAIHAMSASATAAGSGAAEYKLDAAQLGAFQLVVPQQPAFARAAEPSISPNLADKPYAVAVHRAALEASIDPALVHAVIFVESRYNPAARSSKGAVGLMQLMPETASRYGVLDPARSVEGNLKAGTLYLRDLLRQFDNQLELVLAAYNAGENAVVRYGQRIPPYPETQAYVPAVLSKYREWREPPPPTVPARVEYLVGTRLRVMSIGEDR